MGVLRSIFRAVFIIIILNMLDSILCIVLPVLNNEMHFFPSISDTCGMVSSAPFVFSGKMGFKFDVIRPLILVVALSLTVAAISYKQKDTIMQYEAVIFFSYIIYKVMSIYSLSFPLTSMNNESMSVQSMLGFIVFDAIKVLIFHIPFALLSLIIFLVAHKYKEIVEEIRVLGEEKK